MTKGILIASLAVGLVAAGLAADLASVYKKGRITLTPDPDFAKGADWEDLFPTKQRTIAVAPDGSVFVANAPDHNIHKFSTEGKLVKTFGKRGQGPGDFQRPGELSVLDDATLVVGEFMESRRISLFKLDGTFHAVYRTDGPPSSPRALRNGKIAYIALTGTLEREGDEFVDVNVNKVMVLDTATGRSRQVALIKTSVNTPRDGEVKIARSADGDLLVGHTIRPEIETYGPDGAKKGSIKLAIDPIPVTKAIAENHQVKQVYRVDGRSALVVRPMGDFLPYYCDFMVDAAGNILVFKMSEDPKRGPIVFQVYSPDGAFLCETELDRGPFDLPMNRFMCPRLAFTERGIFGVLPLSGDELETPRLFRVRY
jgi:hypothetical protein